MTKNVKKAEKLPKRYFWQAKSAVERPFGHLTFLIFVKTAFFQFILFDFDKNKNGVLVVFGIKVAMGPINLVF